jgi:hypothetical protein
MMALVMCFAVFVVIAVVYVLPFVLGIWLLISLIRYLNRH